MDQMQGKETIIHFFTKKTYLTVVQESQKANKHYDGDTKF